MASLNFLYTSTGFLGWGMLVFLVVAVFVVGAISYWGWWTKRYYMDIDILEEHGKAGGAIVEYQLKARVLDDGGIKKIQFATLFRWNLKQLPAPSPEGITLTSKGREKARYYKAVNNEYYQVVPTKWVPTKYVVDPETGLTEIVERKEIVFCPVNQDYKEFGKIELKRAIERYKQKGFWEQHGHLVMVGGAIAITGLVLIILIWYVVGVAKDVNATTSALISQANIARAVALP